MKTAENGKGHKLRKGADLSKYRQGWERIFGTKFDTLQKPDVESARNQGRTPSNTRKSGAIGKH